jgi:hypothetical protein
VCPRGVSPNGSIQNGSSRLLISQRFGPRSVPNRHLQDALRTKCFFRASVPNLSHHSALKIERRLPPMGRAALSIVTHPIAARQRERKRDLINVRFSPLCGLNTICQFRTSISTLNKAREGLMWGEFLKDPSRFATKKSQVSGHLPTIYLFQKLQPTPRHQFLSFFLANLH